MNNQEDGQALIDKYYQERLEFNGQVSNKKKELQEFIAKKNRETILPLVQFLEQRIPPHLKKQVTKRFSFTEEESGEKISMFRLIEERTFAFIGIMILRDIPLSEEEVVELNAAWNPIAGIDPKSRTFWLGSSELSRNMNKRSLDRLDELIKLGRQSQQR